MKRYRKTPSFAPGQMDGHKPRKLSGPHRNWLIERCRAGALTLRGLVAELAERGLSVDFRSVGDLVHAEKLGYQGSP